MHIDFKITTWERVIVPNNLKDEVLQAIKDEKITSSNGLHDWLSENGHEVDTEYSIIPEVEEKMTVEENGGFSTIEVWENDSLDGNRNPMKMTWENGKNR